MYRYSFFKDVPYTSHTFYTPKSTPKSTYGGQTKREGNIWHNLGGNTIILFFNHNNQYINNKETYWVCFLLSFKAKLNRDNCHDYLI